MSSQFQDVPRKELEYFPEGGGPQSQHMQAPLELSQAIGKKTLQQAEGCTTLPVFSKDTGEKCALIPILGRL